MFAVSDNSSQAFLWIVLVAVVVMLVWELRRFLRDRTGGASLVLLGGAVGGVLGYLLRPSIPMLGQLPFQAVITRGESLSGMDLMLKGAAETSFNYMVVGALIGCLAAVTLVKTSSHGPVASQQVAASSGPSPSTDSSQPTPAPASTGFCIKCGKALPSGAEFCAVCGAKKATA
jgi:hypothetical protein